MSPKEQKMTPGWAAMASALSMSSSGVTQNRAAGAVNHLDAGRKHLVDAVLDDGVVWPPQTSMIFQGRVVME